MNLHAQLRNKRFARSFQNDTEIRNEPICATLDRATGFRFPIARQYANKFPLRGVNLEAFTVVSVAIQFVGQSEK